MEFGIFHAFPSAEINVGSLLSHAQVMNPLRLYCQEVMPRFK